MCGIAGFIDYSINSQASPSERLERMLRTIEHRGPDDWGIVFFGYDVAEKDPRIISHPTSEYRLALGHRRLSIIDLSESGRQPMTFPGQGLTIVFNGEIYNYPELRNTLKSKYDFNTDSDTEVLLYGFHYWGIHVLEHLDGMFSFAIWDSRKKQLFCARDPVGIKPFYYSANREGFVFGSEPRTVLAGLGTAGSVDHAHFAEFLVLGLSDHDDGTFYQEVKQLPGGHYMLVNASENKITSKEYWTPKPKTVRESEVVLTVSRLMKKSIFRRLRSDVPVGSCLSGGLDSGAIVMTVGQILGDQSANYKCLTLTNPDFPFDEGKNASITAARAGCQWVPVTPGEKEIKKDILTMAQAMEEPFSGLSIWAQYKIMARAAELDLKVMLDGQGGDEIFIGYPRMAQQIVWELLRTGNIRSAWRELNCMKKNLSQPILRTLASIAYFRSAEIAFNRSIFRLKKFLKDGYFNNIRHETVRDLFQPCSFRERQIAELRHHCLPRLLRFEDRNSMAFSVEARVPILSKYIIEFGLSLPLNWKLRDGWSKYALRKAMDGVLPDQITWNTLKQGFDVPEGDWVKMLQPDIQDWADEIPRNFPVKSQQVLRAVEKGLGGSQWLWRLISGMIWVRNTKVSV